MDFLPPLTIEGPEYGFRLVTGDHGSLTSGHPDGLARDDGAGHTIQATMDSPDQMTLRDGRGGTATIASDGKQLTLVRSQSGGVSDSARVADPRARLIGAYGSLAMFFSLVVSFSLLCLAMAFDGRRFRFDLLAAAATMLISFNFWRLEILEIYPPGIPGDYKAEYDAGRLLIGGALLGFGLLDLLRNLFARARALRRATGSNTET
jgi:hypothetical protein